MQNPPVSPFSGSLIFKKKLIFSQNIFQNHFSNPTNLQSHLSGRCATADIDNVLNETYKSTSFIVKIRRPIIILTWTTILFLVVFFCGFLVELVGFAFPDTKMSYSTVTMYGLKIMSLSLLIYVIFFMVMIVIFQRNQAMVYKEMMCVLEKQNKETFEKIWMRWSAPPSCRWLELWIENLGEMDQNGIDEEAQTNSSVLVQE